ITPWREWELRSREEEIEYAKRHNIPIAAENKTYSMDRNIWHLSHEGSDLEDPWNAPQDNMFLVTRVPEQAPDEDEHITIDFEEGIPVAVNSKRLGAKALLTLLNEIGARHGIGITDLCENRLVGMKSRGVYENPGGAILFYAHRELEYLCLDRATFHYKELVAHRYAELVYDGMWFSQLREALDAFVDSTQRTVTGTVRLRLYKGNIMSAGAKSKYSLYNQEYVTFEEDDVYNQADGTGFVNLFGLPLKVRALMQKKTGLLK
ncbi:MAG: argininosuccinate synthase, partial [Negativicutes bacterium]